MCVYMAAHLYTCVILSKRSEWMEMCVCFCTLLRQLHLIENCRSKKGSKWLTTVLKCIYICTYLSISGRCIVKLNASCFLIEQLDIQEGTLVFGYLISLLGEFCICITPVTLLAAYGNILYTAYYLKTQYAECNDKCFKQQLHCFQMTSLHCVFNLATVTRLSS